VSLPPDVLATSSRCRAVDGRLEECLNVDWLTEDQARALASEAVLADPERCFAELSCLWTPTGGHWHVKAFAADLGQRDTFEPIDGRGYTIYHSRGSSKPEGL